MFEDPKSEFASYYVPGHTYPVHNKDFLFFTAPTEDEIQKTRILKDTAIKNGFIYNTDLGVFN